MSTVTDLAVDDQRNESSCVFGQKHLNGLVLKAMYTDFKLYYVHVLN